MDKKGTSFIAGASEKMQKTPLGKLSERVKEIAHLRTVLAQVNFTPDLVFNSSHC
jgi:hypothetical protein